MALLSSDNDCILQHMFPRQRKDVLEIFISTPSIKSYFPNLQRGLDALMSEVRELRRLLCADENSGRPVELPSGVCPEAVPC